jgi:hypothetical protein
VIHVIAWMAVLRALRRILMPQSHIDLSNGIRERLFYACLRLPYLPALHIFACLEAPKQNRTLILR